MIILLNHSTRAQFGLSVKTYPLAHYLVQSEEISYSNVLKNNSKQTICTGISLGAEYFTSGDRVSAKILWGVHRDRMSKLSTFMQIGARGYIYKKKEHSFYIGVGPAIFLRNTWAQIPGYDSAGYYTQQGVWDYKFSVFSAELGYNYEIRKRLDLSVSLFHVEYEALAVSFGLSYWLGKRIRGKSCNCPSMKNNSNRMFR